MILFYYGRKGIDMRKIHNYILLIILFVLFIFGITMTHLYIKYSETGTVNVNKKYSDIIFTNTIIDYESDLSVKANSNDDSIHVEIPNLKEYKEFEFSVDATNVGNVDTIVEGYSISNIVSNVNVSDISIETSLLKDEIIKGSVSKKIIIKVKYLGKEKEPYINFNINYLFNEVK